MTKPNKTRTRGNSNKARGAKVPTPEQVTESAAEQAAVAGIAQVTEAATESNKTQARLEILASSDAVAHGRAALSDIVEGATRAAHGTASLTVALVLAHYEGIMSGVSSYDIPGYRAIPDPKAAGLFRDLLLRDICGCTIEQEQAVTKNGKTKAGKRLVFLPWRGNGENPKVPASKISSAVYRALDCAAGIIAYREHLRTVRKIETLPAGFGPSGDPCVSPDFLAHYFKTPVFDSKGALDLESSVNKADNRHHTCAPLLSDFQAAASAGRANDRYNPTTPIGRFGHTGSVLYGATLEHVAKIAEQWTGRVQTRDTNKAPESVHKVIQESINDSKLSWADVSQSLMAHMTQAASLEDPAKARAACNAIAESMVDSALTAWPGLVRVLDKLIARLWLGKGPKPVISKDDLHAVRTLEGHLSGILELYEQEFPETEPAKAELKAA